MRNPDKKENLHLTLPRPIFISKPFQHFQKLRRSETIAYMKRLHTRLPLYADSLPAQTHTKPKKEAHPAAKYTVLSHRRESMLHWIRKENPTYDLEKLGSSLQEVFPLCTNGLIIYTIKAEARKHRLISRPFHKPYFEADELRTLVDMDFQTSPHTPNALQHHLA
jgi:hypothetical protein